MPRGSGEIPKGLTKDWRKLAEAIRDAGWTFDHGAKHVKAYASDGRTRATLSCTPSDVAAWRNARGGFRRWCRENAIDPGI